jgi:hypothetical protein
MQEAQNNFISYSTYQLAFVEFGFW